MTALVQVTMNNLMKTCGAASVYGSDIALSVYGASMKVYQIAHAMFVGVSSATQPINGFNYGAKKLRPCPGDVPAGFQDRATGIHRLVCCISAIPPPTSDSCSSPESRCTWLPASISSDYI